MLRMFRESNEKIIAVIINYQEVKMQLSRNGIKVPEANKFFLTGHNRATDEVFLFCNDATEAIKKLKHNLEKALSINNIVFLKKLYVKNVKQIVLRSAQMIGPNARRMGIST